MASAMSVTWNSSKHEQPALLGDLAGGEPDGVFAVDFAVLQALAKHPDSLVNIGHKLVKMCTSLADHRTCFEEQVHQHGLAAADVAVDVEALDRLVLRPAAEQPADRPRPARRAVRGDAALQRH